MKYLGRDAGGLNGWDEIRDAEGGREFWAVRGGVVVGKEEGDSVQGPGGGGGEWVPY